MPSTAKSPTSGSISAYAGPPTKVTARSLRTTAPMLAMQPMAATRISPLRYMLRRSVDDAIDGKAITTTNWGRNSTALVRISPPA